VTTNWMSLWQRMSGLFFADTPAMEEEEEVIINDDVLLQFDGGNDITTVDLNEAIEPRLNDFIGYCNLSLL